MYFWYGLYSFQRVFHLFFLCVEFSAVQVKSVDLGANFHPLSITSTPIKRPRMENGGKEINDTSSGTINNGGFHITAWYHSVKGLVKKIDALGKEKACGEVLTLRKSVVNHLYRCGVSSKTGDEAVAKWRSITNHVHHHHSSEIFPVCAHLPLEERASLKPNYMDTLLKMLFEDVIPNPDPYQKHMRSLMICVLPSKAQTVCVCCFDCTVCACSLV